MIDGIRGLLARVTASHGKRLFESVSPEYIFLIIYTLFSIVIIAIHIPGWNTDEPAHYARIQQIASGDLFPNIEWEPSVANGKGGLRASILIDSGAANYIDYWTQQLMNQDLQPEDGYNWPLDYTGAGYTHHTTDSVETSSYLAINAPGMYVPHVIGVVLSKAIGCSLVQEYYLVKLVAMLFCGTLLFFSIKLLPFGKWVMLSIALLPFSVVQFSAWSGDGVTTALTYFVCSLILSCALEQGRSKDDRRLFLKPFVLCLSLIAMALVKISYFPVVFLVLLLPVVNKDYRSKRTIPLIAALLFSVAVFLYWYACISGIIQFWGSDPSGQQEYVMSHPLAFLKAVFKTIMIAGDLGRFSYDYLLQSSLIGSFYWERQPLPIYFAILSVASVTVGMFIENRRPTNMFTLDPRAVIFAKALVFIVNIVIVLLIFYALYAQCNVVGAAYVTNIAGRYFLPLLPLLLIVPFAFKTHETPGVISDARTLGRVKSIVVVFVVLSLIATVAALSTPYLASVTYGASLIS
jgi:uncharacterized membrane protein